MNFKIEEEIKTKLFVVTKRALVLKLKMDLTDLCIILNLSKTTLYLKLKKHHWSYEEKLIIDHLTEKYSKS